MTNDEIQEAIADPRVGDKWELDGREVHGSNALPISWFYKHGATLIQRGSAEDSK